MLSDDTSGDPGAESDLHALYASFEPLNRELKQLVVRWQVRSVGGMAVATDCSGERMERGDGSVLDELGHLHHAARRLLERAGELVAEVEGFLPRLDLAAARVAEGQTEYLSGGRVDSYHLAWWELHSTLLRQLGRERSEDAS